MKISEISFLQLDVNLQLCCKGKTLFHKNCLSPSLFSIHIFYSWYVTAQDIAFIKTLGENYFLIFEERALFMLIKKISQTAPFKMFFPWMTEILKIKQSVEHHVGWNNWEWSNWPLQFFSFSFIQCHARETKINFFEQF